MINKIILFIKRNFIYSSKLDYTKIKNYNLDDIFNKLIYKLDNHAQIIEDDGTFKPKFIKPRIIKYVNKIRLILPSYVGILETTSKSKFGNIYADVCNSALYNAMQNKIETIEIDLRNNYGGYDPTMIVGLQSLFEDNEILYQSVDNKNKIKNYYLLNFNEYYKYKLIRFKYKPSMIKVLVNKNTISAGEIVAACFLNKSNVIFKGKSTYGALTKTCDLRIGENKWIMFTKELIIKNNKIINKILI